MAIAQMTSNLALSEELEKIQTWLETRITKFKGNEEEDYQEFPLSEEIIAWGGLKLDTTVISEESQSDDGYILKVRFDVVEGELDSSNLAIQFKTGSWSESVYVLMPGAVYAGNRFRAVDSNYTSAVSDPSKGMEPVISNQQRLNIDEGVSRIDLRSGDFTTPGVAYHFPESDKALLILTDQTTNFGDTGISLIENDDRTEALTLFSAPCVRPGKHNALRGDHGCRYSKGDSVEFRLYVRVFDADDINGLFRGFFDSRNALRSNYIVRNDIPFSSCWEIQEDKYNRQNWVDEYGYYSVGMRESASQDWQSGWVGGMNTVYPLISEGDAQTLSRVLRTFDFLTNDGQTESGFYLGGFYKGKWGSGECLLQRTNADVLYFMLKEYRLLEGKYGLAIPESWRNSTQKLAETFCKLWEREGQFGHRIDVDTGDIVWGNTASAAIVCGGLVLASKYFDDSRFLQVARASAEYYYREYVSRGIINGGPGDHLQCPDSEATAGMLDSFITLYEETGEAHWLKYAMDTAHQLASWTMTYDFIFPTDSTFGKLDMLTTGTVFANIQNKHSAPGICSLSGNALFKLFRATGDVRYLDLIREIAHAIPQYMSREDRPIYDIRPGQRWPVMAPGWINERVNTSDWEVRDDPVNEIGVGEVFGGSTWSEVAMMLTYAELPGIYIQSDTKLLSVLDHVEAELVNESSEAFALRIHNPTKFHASVKVMVETNHDAQANILGPASMYDLPRAEVPAGESIIYRQ